VVVVEPGRVVEEASFTVKLLLVGPSPQVEPAEVGQHCSFAFTDIDGDNITVEGIWFKNGIYNGTFNYTKTALNGTLTYADKLVTPLAAGEQWICSIKAPWRASTPIFIANYILAEKPNIAPIV